MSSGDIGHDQIQERPGLRDFQTWMQTFIVSRGSSQDALEAAEQASGFPQGSAERLVKRSATLDEVERLMIYRRMYPLRMEDALGTDFPVCRLLVGRKRFFQLVMDYVEAHPSRSWTLDHLGRHMVEFVKEHPLSREFPGLYDLTRLEQALCEVFDELDAPVLSAADLLEVTPEDWPNVRLQTIPAFRLLSLQTNANDLFRAYAQGQGLPDVETRPQYVVVWRQDFQTWRMPVDEAASVVLGSLSCGESLGETLEHAVERYSIEESEVFDWFQTWVGEGFFSSWSSC